MLFHSTRGKDKDKTFEQVLMQGLAKDGGLYMPNNWPKVDIHKLKDFDNFIWQELLKIQERRQHSVNKF